MKKSSFSVWKNEAVRFLVAATTSLVPMSVLAAPLKPTVAFTTVDDIQVRVFCVVMYWMFTFALVISIIFVLYAAYLYLSSAGEPEKVSKANKTIVYAAVGVAVALLARSVPSVVGSVLDVQFGTLCP